MDTQAKLPDSTLPFASYQTNNDPTAAQYGVLTEAYDWFNASLFDGRLPPCLITLRANRSEYGFFSGNRFGTKLGDDVIDEIALNAKHFQPSTTEDILSTLVHEMVHLEQHHFGTPSRGGYHNREWGALMKRVGLYPSSTEKPGGKETGQRVSHYIIEGGPFSVSSAELIATGFSIKYVDLQKHREKTPSKVKYCCVSCDARAWAKPNTNLVCGDCQNVMSVGGAL
jgi:predicted SprT family Zn-dependent metalloprotease